MLPAHFLDDIDFSNEAAAEPSGARDEVNTALYRIISIQFPGGGPYRSLKPPAKAGCFRGANVFAEQCNTFLGEEPHAISDTLS